MSASSDEEVQQLLQLYDSMGGVAPRSQPELQELFGRIAQTKKQAPASADVPCETIYPTPSFVIKTGDDTGRKVFVNMCSSDHVAAPSTWHDGVMPDSVADALAQAQGTHSDISADTAEALRLPLSLSEPRNDLDKHGQACTVFDCVFSTTVLAEASRLRAMKVFVIETVIGWINHKHSLGLDQRYKLPKLRYKGDTVHSHRIRKDKKQLVTEISELDDVDDTPGLPLRSVPVPAEKRATAESKLKSAKENTSLVHKTLMSDAVSPASKTGTPQPALQAALRETTAANGPTLLNVAFEGSPCTHICVQVSLPAGKRCSGDNIGVMAAIDVLHVRAAGFAPLAVATNVYIQPESCMCVLSGGVLTIRARYNSVSDLIALAESNRPLPVGSIPLRSEVLVDRLE